MAQLGEFQFSLETAAFDTLTRASEYRWATQQRIGRQPASQFIGLGEDKIELSGTIYPHFRGGLGQVGLMREIASEGVPLPLIYSFENVGQYAGLWCINSISDNRSEFIRVGAAKKIEFSLSLTAYGADETTEADVLLRVMSLLMSSEAGMPPSLSGKAISALLQNSLAVSGLVDVFESDWGGTDFYGAITGALGGASIAATAKAAIVQIAAKNGLISSVFPSLGSVMSDLANVKNTISNIARDTTASVGLVIDSASAVKNIVQSASNEMRQSAQNALAGTGRIESAYQSVSGNIVAAASLSNVVRAGNTIVYAATESARQLESIAGKIKV